jgi:hypothetical protein
MILEEPKTITENEIKVIRDSIFNKTNCLVKYPIEIKYKDSGNSAGCFVLSRPEIEDLKAFVTPGTFVYAANCPRAS